MSNPNAKPPEHTKWKPGQSGNPAGPKPGYKHLATWIQEMLNDDEFTTYLQDPVVGYKEFKGAPVKAIVGTAILKAANNDAPAREWLAKHGYGTKLTLATEDPIEVLLRKYGIEEGKDDRQADEAVSGPPESTT